MDSVNPRSLGDVLNARRRARKWSLDELASRSGYNYNTVFRVMHGCDARYLTIENIANALDLTIALTPRSEHHG